jgi:8-oxo-dGTP diphosphatase
MDQFEVVRAYYRAWNRSDVDALAALLDASCVTENLFVDERGEAALRGRDENRRRIQEFVDTYEGGFEGGRFYSVRTIAGIGTGWGWVQADWSQRLRRREDGAPREVRGYTHFLVEDGRIRRQRSVATEIDPGGASTTAAAATTASTPTGEAPQSGPALPGYFRSGDAGREALEPGSRQYPARPVVGIGAVVLVRPDDHAIVGEGRTIPAPAGVILIKRRYEPLAGQWSLPGGTLETGETLEAGVAREVSEETGLFVDVGAVVDVFDRILLDADRRVRYHFVLIDYLCRPCGGRLNAGSDVSDVVVADPADLAAYGTTLKVQSVVSKAIELGARS